MIETSRSGSSDAQPDRCDEMNQERDIPFVFPAWAAAFAVLVTGFAVTWAEAGMDRRVDVVPSLMASVAMSGAALVISAVAGARRRGLERAARLAHDLRYRLHQQALLGQLASRALQTTDERTVLEETLKVACGALRAPLGLMLLMDDGGGLFRPRVAQGWPEHLIHRITFDDQPTSEAGFTLREGKATLVADARTETRFAPLTLPGGPAVVSGLSVPIRAGAETFGVIALHSPMPDWFHEDDAHFAEALAHILALALARMRMEAQVERQRAEAALQSLVASHTEQAAIITDGAGRIEWVNDGFTLVTGYRLEDVSGRTPGSVLQGPGSDAAVVALMRERVAAGMAFVAEVVNYHKSGRPYWAAIDAQPIHDDHGRLTHFIAITRDITARKSAEQAVAAANKALADRNREMEMVVGTVSHDLKSPLVTMSGFLHRAERQLADRTDVRGALESLTRVEGAVETMRQTIDGLLALARSGLVAGNMALVHTDELVRGVVAQLADRFAARGATVSVAGPLPNVRGDRGRLAELLENLLTNALKYGCPADGGGRVVVGARRLADEVQLFVRDHGPGIPIELQERVFDLFQRLDSSQEGSGLGLAIVRRIASAHGGEAWVESTPGRGATFWVSLPDEPEHVLGRPLAVVEPKSQHATRGASAA